MQKGRGFLERCGLALMVLGVGVSAGAQDLREYWPMEVFLERHAEQRPLMEAFDRRVTGPGIPIPAEQRPDAPVRVSVIYPGLEISDYWRRNLVAFERRARELDLPLDLQVFFSGSTRDQAALQAEQLRAALAESPDFLVYTLDTPTHTALIDRLLARTPGVDGPHIILQNITTPVRAWNGLQPLLYVGFDHLQGSRLLLEHIRAQAEEGDEIVVLYGTDGYVSRARGDLLTRSLMEVPAPRLRDTYLTDQDVDIAEKATLDALARYPDLSFIYACTTDTALTSIRTLAAEGRTDVEVTGWGGGSAELRAIQEGALSATVMRLNDDAGVAMAEAVSLQVRGLGHDVPQIYSGGMQLVTRDTPPEALEQLMQRAFRYSGVPDWTSH
ncbi:MULTISPECIES: substrate-binding domain-containing protein [unclassified Ectothiorhodospira]|uniref:substrate-binding domain-containing protein n=1 Tax=unclassified Ectothiorhodospira TaxID=2684909 RepID=UPI001EE9698C|nr:MULTISPECIES: substrate-binding domain-containing protein [unclassified Ectothiorhodospira]MCG5514522.1 substrate-binding domain-containing protein [Ectothiorhodospira sp. 9100]MCG5518674.1 substrate-binding domain-containing protein [Ectothiorhodospira sp. 9905]